MNVLWDGTPQRPLGRLLSMDEQPTIEKRPQPPIYRPTRQQDREMVLACLKKSPHTHRGLMEMTGLDRDAVAAALQAIKAKGLVRSDEVVPGQNRQQGRRYLRLYRLVEAI